MIKSVLLLVGIMALSSCSGKKESKIVVYFCPTVFGIVQGDADNSKIEGGTIAIKNVQGDTLEMPVNNCFKVTKAAE